MSVLVQFSRCCLQTIISILSSVLNTDSLSIQTTINYFISFMSILTDIKLGSYLLFPPAINNFMLLFLLNLAGWCLPSATGLLEGGKNRDFQGYLKTFKTIFLHIFSFVVLFCFVCKLPVRVKEHIFMFLEWTVRKFF